MITMKKGSIYTVTVLQIDQCVKQIPGPKKCKHILTVKDKEGAQFKCEYLSNNETVSSDEFVIGLPHTVMCIEAKLDWKPTIEPYDEEAEKKEKIIAAIDAVQRAPLQTFKSNSSLPENSATLNISGKSITFATAYAKDLLVAEMKNWAPGREVDASDVKRMLTWADVITEGIAERVKFE